MKLKRDLIKTKSITFTTMINVGRKEISRIEADDNGIRRTIVKVCAEINGEIKVIWEAIRSCFGSGF